MLATPPAWSGAQLHDPHARCPADVGLEGPFSTVAGRVPPLADVPPDLASRVLHGGLGLDEAQALYQHRRRRQQLESQQQQEQQQKEEQRRRGGRRRGGGGHTAPVT